MEYITFFDFAAHTTYMSVGAGGARGARGARGVSGFLDVLKQFL